MTVQYIQLQYEEYKELEQQMREFAETTHKSVEGFYHKSIRLRINSDLIIEFLGPLVLAGAAILEPEEPREPLHPAGDKHAVHASKVLPLEDPCDLGHIWVSHPKGGRTCQRCGVCSTGGA